MEAFGRMEENAVKAVPEMLRAGADIIANTQKKEAESMGIKETGGFIESIRPTSVKGNGSEKYVDIYPQGRARHGNDRKGDGSNVRYATIGFVAEYGSSSIQARPYMTVANEKAHDDVMRKYAEIWEDVNA